MKSPHPVFPAAPSETRPTAPAEDLSAPEIVARIYRESPPTLRSKVLECLLRPLGPLALASLAHGAFGVFLIRSALDGLRVSAEDTLAIAESQVLELARYVEQSSPGAFAQIATMLAKNPVFAQTLTGSLLLVALGTWIGKRTRARA